jgi:hypothetical protein
MKGAGKSNIQVHCAPSSPFANFPFLAAASLSSLFYFSRRASSQFYTCTGDNGRKVHRADLGANLASQLPLAALRSIIMKIIEIMTGVEKLVTRNVAAGKRIHRVCLLGYMRVRVFLAGCREDAVSALMEFLALCNPPSSWALARRYTFRGRPFLIKTITTSRCKQDACVWLFDYGVDKAGTFFYHTRLKGFHQKRREVNTFFLLMGQ